MMEENVWAPGTEPCLYTKLIYRSFWLQNLKVFVWPYWDMRDKSDLVSEAISFWDMAFLPYWVMEAWSGGKLEDITQLVVSVVRYDGEIKLEHLCDVTNLSDWTSWSHTDYFTFHLTCMYCRLSHMVLSELFKAATSSCFQQRTLQPYKAPISRWNKVSVKLVNIVR